ncbi:MAG: bifunctional transcriptional activator/DNA repair enzyme protein Ada, partial [Betaproteobacteria bacterium]|nr:bifunctional transcriptional activator/DNA repair enzyme protein Ada [Betaproteobacteria bacterium]
MYMSTSNSKPAATEADPRWEAIIARNPAADGTFYYAVRTTGVYCRPTCPSRRPLRSNVDFFAGSVTDAIYDSGYNSNARFYEKAGEVLGMSPRAYRAGGTATDIRFAVGECALGAILVAKSERGVCAILL